MDIEEKVAKRLGYTDLVIEHFKNPRNMGRMDDATTSAKVGSVACGDLIKIYLKIDEKTKRIEKSSFESYGCAANIATSSVLTEMVKGKTIEEARKITFNDIAQALGGLPRIKMHCAVLSRQGLEAALLKYEIKSGQKILDKSLVERLLRGVLDPVMGTDIISAGLVKDVKVEGKKVNITLKASGDVGKMIQDDIKEAFEGLDIEMNFHLIS
ncbi:MAG: iron-sulfur cluster assembly scaffold protein [Nitrososphaerota archaeon]|nr:iron-sulfur cluster assembly scaffold protein [Nitrososphaerales archaeon]MCX8191692.1 iron-sulfur cluster assembly scaffold protein [Nitrososphaerales archaeon]MDW8045344.1 iron-sulfur cluster assembly scaffold protein [Nitrososphaerota archaeon]